MKKISYDVVSEFAGHKHCEMVSVEEASRNIFSCCKEKGMQMAVNGEFMQFESIGELQGKLEATAENVSIKIVDELIGG